MWGVSKFRLYLAGKPFALQTNHQPLNFLKDAKFRNVRIMRWALALREYDYTVKLGRLLYSFGEEGLGFL